MQKKQTVDPTFPVEFTAEMLGGRTTALRAAAEECQFAQLVAQLPDSHRRADLVTYAAVLDTAEPISKPHFMPRTKFSKFTKFKRKYQLRELCGLCAR